MRKITLILAFLYASIQYITAQDIIVLSNNDTISAKVLKIAKEEIEFKKLSYLDGPSYTLNVNEIEYIKFPGGNIEYFQKHDNKRVSSTVSQTGNQAIQKKAVDKDAIKRKINSYKGNLLKRGNYVYVKPHSIKSPYEEAGAEALKEAIIYSGIWKLVSSPDVAHFILEYNVNTSGLDKAFVVIMTRTQNNVRTEKYSTSEDIEQNKKVANHIFKHELKRYVEMLDKGKTPYQIKKLEIK